MLSDYVFYQSNLAEARLHVLIRGGVLVGRARLFEMWFFSLIHGVRRGRMWLRLKICEKDPFTLLMSTYSKPYKPKSRL